MSHPRLALPEWNGKNVVHVQIYETVIIHDVEHLCFVLHISLVDKSLQFYLFGMHNIPLVHPILRKSFGY